jgi:phosphatidylserine/phosphatidylglycerophosphate/cardiolipin synthase-like enzyme
MAVSFWRWMPLWRCGESQRRQQALAAAVDRGVAVTALIAHTNRAGEEKLRQLETRLLGNGVTVARTADDLLRYHGKMMVVDRSELFLLAFNLTRLDLLRSRSFGIITKAPDLVREAVKLFEADVKRHAYEPGNDKFIVSPVNARRRLAEFLGGAKKQLLIYDPEVSDPAMIHILEERAKSGVDIRIVGKLRRKSPGLHARKLARIRLHTRAIIRDRSAAFVGSQSLRELELDARREVGILFREAKIIARMAQIFEEDWEQSGSSGASAGLPAHTAAAKVARKIAKTLTNGLPPVAPVVDQAVREMAGGNGCIELDVKEVEWVVKDAVKSAVRDAIRNVVEEVVEQDCGSSE